jgi:hypothetical protein
MSPSATTVPIHETSIPRSVRGIPPPQATGRLLNEVLLESQRLKGGSKTADVLLALLLHVIGDPILAGLYYADTIDLKQFATTFLAEPPPPPPPPPAAAVGVVKPKLSKRVFISEGKLLAPKYIPKQVALAQGSTNRIGCVPVVRPEAFPCPAASWTAWLVV